MITLSNTIHWLSEQSVLQPNNRAIISENRSLVYSEIWNECLSACAFLEQHGIAEKDHVGILFEHSYKFFVIINALWLIGAVPVPLNTRNTNEEIEIQLHQADIKHLIIDENISEQYLHLHFKNKIQITQSLFTEEPEKNIAVNSPFSTLYAGKQFLNSALIMFTSGSSGNAKAVVHTFKNLFESTRMLDTFTNLTGSDVWLASLPLYHIGGFMILIRALLSGGILAFPKSLKYEDINKAITVFNPTHVSVVSTTLNRLIKEDFVPPTNLKFVFLGGGPVTHELCMQAVNKGFPLVKVYGSTETCSMVTAIPANKVKQKPDSVGKVLGTNKIKIKSMSQTDPDVFCCKGEIGEIVVSSQSLFSGYYGNKVTTEKVLKDGWYHTGDYGWLDEEGYLYISSRREDLIITGGENVSAVDIENLIKTIDKINDASVFALKDDMWGEIVCAAIVSEKISELEIINFLKEKIAGYKIPKRFFFINSIPRNDMGKVNRAALFSKLNLS